MTAQLSDSLRYEGEALRLFTLPLNTYWNMASAANDSDDDSPEKRRDFADMGTWCWRRHTASWAIEQGHLYLIGIHANYEDGGEAMLEDFFPGYPNRVFAHWYSGQLRCSRGELLEYVHAGFGSRYEEDLLIDIDRGVVKDQHVIDNRTESERQ